MSDRRRWGADAIVNGALAPRARVLARFARPGRNAGSWAVLWALAAAAELLALAPLVTDRGPPLEA